jgi:DNA-binding NarL/FixJ family response regulator
MTRVLLVDDHAAFRQPLAFMIDREPDLTVTAQAGTLAEARRRLNDIDIAIVDLDLPDGNGADIVRDLRAANPDGAVLVLTGSADRRQYARAVEAGAAGVIHKSAGIAEIINAVRRLIAGELLFTPHEVMELFQLAGQQQQDRAARAALESLTPREQELLHALAKGLNDKAIAQHLHISVETARTHMVNILRKLNVESRLQALVLAARHGAVTIS